MSTGRGDIKHMVVVPDDPAPIVALASIDGTRTEIDAALDDMFGEVDNDGPGVTDAVLLAGGSAAVIASLVAALPGFVLIGGLAGIGLGSILPIRSGLRQVRERKRTATIASTVGDGHLLDTRSRVVAETVRLHGEVFAAADSLDEPHRVRMRNVAHGLVVEIALLLEGRDVELPIETTYVAERRDALRSLLAACGNVATGRTGERQAMAEAQVLLDGQASNTALSEAADLAAELRFRLDG